MAPWVTSNGGARVLPEAAGGGVELRGTFAYELGGVLSHATRVVREQATAPNRYEANLATTNPLSTIHLKIARTPPVRSRDRDRDRAGGGNPGRHLLVLHVLELREQHGLRFIGTLADSRPLNPLR